MDYTKDDVRLVAKAISVYDYDNGVSANGEVSRHQRAEARVALDALAAAGRLLPADARAEDADLQTKVARAMRAVASHDEPRWDVLAEQLIWTVRAIDRLDANGSGVPVEPAAEPSDALTVDDRKHKPGCEADWATCQCFEPAGLSQKGDGR
jgi:hypothetical protein